MKQERVLVRLSTKHFFRHSKATWTRQSECSSLSRLQAAQAPQKSLLGDIVESFHVAHLRGFLRLERRTGLQDAGHAVVSVNLGTNSCLSPY